MVEEKPQATQQQRNLSPALDLIRSYIVLSKKVDEGIVALKRLEAIAAKNKTQSNLTREGDGNPSLAEFIELFSGLYTMVQLSLQQSAVICEENNRNIQSLSVRFRAVEEVLSKKGVVTKEEFDTILNEKVEEVNKARLEAIQKASERSIEASKANMNTGRDLFKNLGKKAPGTEVPDPKIIHFSK